MRLKSIELTWFRGAGESAMLQLDTKSAVVYGTNGAGKSSFVDAVEFALHGKVNHLASEHSGKRQEKALINRLMPRGQIASMSFRFADNSHLTISFDPSGNPTHSGTGPIDMRAWEYRRTVLRQDEVSKFVHATKGEKYSALLPLLGLGELEDSAENLRRLRKSVEEQLHLAALRHDLAGVKQKRASQFGAATDDEIRATIRSLHSVHCPGANPPADDIEYCTVLTAALEQKLAASSTELRRHVALERLADNDIPNGVASVRRATDSLASAAGSLITERLAVLSAARSFAEHVQTDQDLECPACGQRIPIETLRDHLASQHARLEKQLSHFRQREAAIRNLRVVLGNLRTCLLSPVLDPWRDELAASGLAEAIAHAQGMTPDFLEECGAEASLLGVESLLLPLVQAAAAGAAKAPPDAHRLAQETKSIAIAREVLLAAGKQNRLDRIESFVAFLTSLEAGIRDKIRERSQLTIDQLSGDIQSMWATLHPGEPISDVCLYIPADSDKAIDIGLTFHGVKQDSPNLTLSEGHRNSLGLCIFLAMAKSDTASDRPLLLDDVVVSLDRSHRGMIRDLLHKEFSNRQVIVLTHDRDWYTELRHLLDEATWSFKALLPYDTPDLGIRWSRGATSFDDARSQLQHRPDVAGNDARKIMDVELAVVVEKLRIQLPFFRGEKNDQRMAQDFLHALKRSANRAFQPKPGATLSSTGMVATLDEAAKLLLAWGNRSSHSFNLVQSEATKLLDACERVLALFACSTCGKKLWYAESAKEAQCSCGALRWRWG